MDSLKDLLLAPFIAFLIPIMWALAKIPIAYIHELIMRKQSLIKIDLRLDTELAKLENVRFFCLIIRYGTDSYIKDMASNNEKYDGRLRNTVIEGSLENGQLIYRIPLHKRIGTQFKCFLETPTKEAVDQIMKNRDIYKNISDLSFSCSNNRNRIFFILKGHGTTKSVD